MANRIMNEKEYKAYYDEFIPSQIENEKETFEHKTIRKFLNKYPSLKNIRLDYGHSGIPCFLVSFEDIEKHLIDKQLHDQSMRKKNDKVEKLNKKIEDLERRNKNMFEQLEDIRLRG